jgi:mono/diheme cytochrome c family protein
MVSLVEIFLACVLLARAADSSVVEYGRQLVEDVAKCGDCHTPRKTGGEFDRSERLKGARLPKASPDLTTSGHLFARWGERGIVKFLETGFDPEGHAADSHMPAYKLRPHDAKAIVAYLKSLK